MKHLILPAYKIVILKQIGLQFLLRIQNAHVSPHPWFQILIRKSLLSTQRERSVCLMSVELTDKPANIIQTTDCARIQTYVRHGAEKNLLSRGTADFRRVTWISHWVRTSFQACLNKALGFYSPICTAMFYARLVGWLLGSCHWNWNKF